MQATLERMRQRRDQRGDEGGFTLIELLIVIVILAILAAIIVFAVQNLTGTSAKASCESDVQTVDHAVQAYMAQTASTTVAETTLLTTAAGGNGGQVGPWLHNTPVNGNHYAVTVATDGSISVLTNPSTASGATSDGWTGGQKWATSTPFSPTAANAASTACAGVTS